MIDLFFHVLQCPDSEETTIQHTGKFDLCLYSSLGNNEARDNWSEPNADRQVDWELIGTIWLKTH